MLQNPIIPGFQPDPAICRVADDYYIATSTFEWYPGVQIHHSRDLKHWRLIDRPLNRSSLLMMEGNMTADGVFAPCLSHDGEKFWLAFSDCKTRHGRWIDINNYVTWTTTLDTPWSEPVYQHGAGIDVSYFHDEDGRSYLLSNLFTPMTEGIKFRNVLLQEVDRTTATLLGEAQVIYGGTELSVTEGPHIYKRHGWYYIVCAEGGTGGGHAVTIARSKHVTGPYETHPDNPILSARWNPEWPLQKTGHASLVETQHGEWYMPFLCSRRIGAEGYSPLGRETAIEKIIWDENGWPQLAHEHGKKARLEVPTPAGLQEHVWPIPDDDPTFSRANLADCWMWLRQADTSSWLELQPGRLRLLGRHSFHSRFEQSLIARRQTAHACEISTRVQFHPKWDNQLAGLMYRYDEYGFYDLSIGWDQDAGRVLRLIYVENTTQTVLAQVALNRPDPVELKLAVDHDDGYAY